MNASKLDFSISTDLFQNTYKGKCPESFEIAAEGPRLGRFNHLVKSPDQLLKRLTEEILAEMNRGKIKRVGFTVAIRGSFAQKFIEVQILSAPKKIVSYPREDTRAVLKEKSQDLRLKYLILPDAREITNQIHRILWGFNRDLAPGEVDIFGRRGDVFFKSSIGFSPRLLRRVALSQARSCVNSCA